MAIPSFLIKLVNNLLLFLIILILFGLHWIYKRRNVLGYNNGFCGETDVIAGGSFPVWIALRHPVYDWSIRNVA